MRSLCHICNENENETDSHACFTCMEGLVSLCTCNKSPMEESFTLSHSCTCSDDIVYIRDCSKEYISKFFIKIKNENDEDDILIINCCEGCSFEVLDTYDKELQANISQCIYDKDFKYIGDALNERFINKHNIGTTDIKLL